MSDKSRPTSHPPFPPLAIVFCCLSPIKHYLTAVQLHLFFFFLVINIFSYIILGCGTGKYLGLAPESFLVGSDSCVEFTEIAAQRGHNIVACDNQSLPFRDGCFDAIISVGVIHHFASEKRRVKALEELYRILRPGGRMLVYVWAFEQEQRKVCNYSVLQSSLMLHLELSMN